MTTVSTTREPTLPGAYSPARTAWDRFWFTPVSPTVLGFLRICCGVIVLYLQIVNTANLHEFLGAHGWVDLETINTLRYDIAQVPLPAGWEEDGGATVFGNRPVWSIWFHVTDPDTMELVQAGILAITTLFLLGFWTRVTSVLTWLAFLSCLYRMEPMLYGMDQMVNVLLLYLMLGPCGAALSLDALWARYCERLPVVNATGAPPGSVAANFSLRLMQLHLCIVYLVAGLAKVHGPTWLSGNAVWDTLVNPEMSLVRYSWYADTLRWLLQDRWRGELVLIFGGWFTLFVEIGFPFLVWHRRLRWPMIVAALLLHLDIAVFVGLPLFGLTMGTLVLSFIPPDDADAGVRRLAAVWRRLTHRSPPPARRHAEPARELAPAAP